MPEVPIETSMNLLIQYYYLVLYKEKELGLTEARCSLLGPMKRANT